MTSLSPTLDGAIARKYGVKSLEYKVQNKLALQEELGWPAETKRALVCLPLGMTDALGGKLLTELLPGLLELPIQLLVLGKGSSSYGKLCTDLAKQHPHKIAIVPNQEAAIRKMLAASDMALLLSDAAQTKELKTLLRYGVVPVAPDCNELENYNPNQESGDAFLYEKPSVWHAFAAVVRALETFKFPYDWRTIQRHTMETAE